MIGRSNAVPPHPSRSTAAVAAAVLVLGGLVLASYGWSWPFVAVTALAVFSLAGEARSWRHWRHRRNIVRISHELTRRTWAAPLEIGLRDLDSAPRVFLVSKGRIGIRYLYVLTDDEALRLDRLARQEDDRPARVDVFVVPRLRRMPILHHIQFLDPRRQGAQDHQGRWMAGTLKASIQLYRSGYLVPSEDDLRGALDGLSRARPAH